MINKIKKIISKIHLIYSNSKQNELMLQDIYGLSLISNMTNINGYLPLNAGSLRPIAISYILNEIMINQKKSIIEFGSGISTLIIAKFFKENNIDGFIYSIEDNQNWANVLTEKLKNEQLDRYVKIIHAPLNERVDNKLGSFMWYNLAVLNEEINREFDMVIIDGPKSFPTENQHARSYALDFIANQLKTNVFILLDDTDRKGEMNIIEYFKDKFGLNFIKEMDTFSIYRESGSFGSRPFQFNPNKIIENSKIND